MSSSRTPLLLDTSFILPAFGVSLNETVDKALKTLSELKGVKVYYSTFNLLEALLVVARELRKGLLKADEAEESVESGTLTTVTNLYKASEPPQIYSTAFKLYALGHGDMFDNLLYSVALTNNIKLLTIDQEFREFIKSRKLKDVTVTPKKLFGNQPR